MWANTAVVFAAAVVLAAAGTPVARSFALRSRLVDEPAARKEHSHPVPLLGGLAIYAAVIGSLLLHPERRELTGLLGILIGATGVSFLGLWDDRRGLGIGTKLAGQLLAAVVLLLSGVQVALPLPALLNLMLTLLWVVGITNAFNLLDNMDGLAGGVGAMAAAFFVVLALANGQFLVAPLSAALLGACVGFLFYNFNPARIFMGDSGSLFLGFVLAAAGIKLRFPSNLPTVTWLVPILVLLVPIFDTTLVVLSRLRRGLNPFSTPGRDHLSHRLVRLGWSRREAVLVIYLLAFAAGLAGVVVSRGNHATMLVAAASAALCSGVGLLFLDRAALVSDPVPQRERG